MLLIQALQYVCIAKQEPSQTPQTPQLHQHARHARVGFIPLQLVPVHHLPVQHVLLDLMDRELPFLLVSTVWQEHIQQVSTLN